MNNYHTPNSAYKKPSQPHEHSLLVTTIKPKLQTNTAQQIPLTSPREKREMKLSALQQSYMDHHNNSFMQCGSTIRDRGYKLLLAKRCGIGNWFAGGNRCFWPNSGSSCGFCNLWTVVHDGFGDFCDLMGISMCRRRGFGMFHRSPFFFFFLCEICLLKWFLKHFC